MKIITFNVNGIRAMLSKDKDGKRDTNNDNALISLINEHEPDIICIQETKCPCNFDININYPYRYFVSSQVKKGYSGVAVFSKIKPINNLTDFSENQEGRVICLEFENFYLLNTYTPNSKPDLSRLDYRVNTWEELIKKYIKNLQKNKNIIYTSDFNVAPTELDIHTVKGHEKTHGFTIQERTAFQNLIKDCNLVDSFRFLYPSKKEFTWFSNFAKSREKNKGWRIDMILVSDKLKSYIKTAKILNDYYNSDHLPYMIEITV